LGAGFNGILTGRENIYTNASILGLTKKETDAKLDEIIDFAEIGDFIDTPVQNYSSGMAVRLGFAVASSLSPDILLLDEVLAVGDAGFRHKCYSRIGQLQEKAAVIFVSHSMEFIAQICDRAVYMDHGKGTQYDNVMEAVEAYNNSTQTKGEEKLHGLRAFYSPVTDADLHLKNAEVAYGEDLHVRFILQLDSPLNRHLFSFAIRNESGTPVAAWRTPEGTEEAPLPIGRSQIDFSLGPLWLVPGKYTCSMGVREEGNAEHKVWLHDQAAFTMTGSAKPAGPVIMMLPYRGCTLKSGDNKGLALHERPT
jgi:lipopolysaccharide transport system ATP-binding protein